MNMMQKIAGYERFKEEDVNFPESIGKVTRLYEDCLSKVVKQYCDIYGIGKEDLKRFGINRTIGETKEIVTLDGKQIGTMEILTGLNHDDFIQNKISFVIQFTPVIPPTT